MTAPSVELGVGAAFSRRVVRLAVTSALVLPLIWLLSTTTLRAHPLIGAALAAGWLLMPLILGLSLRRPRLRYALIVPSSFVSVALLAICLTALPDDNVASAGWLLMTGGVLLGGVLGIWFWFRWMPVPARLTDPFSAGRWALIVAHVSLIVAGLVLVGVSAVA